MKKIRRYFIVISIAVLFSCIAVGQEQEQNIKITDKDCYKIIQLAKTDRIVLLEWAERHYKKTCETIRELYTNRSTLLANLTKNKSIILSL